VGVGVCVCVSVCVCVCVCVCEREREREREREGVRMTHMSRVICVITHRDSGNFSVWSPCV